MRSKNPADDVIDLDDDEMEVDEDSIQVRTSNLHCFILLLTLIVISNLCLMSVHCSNSPLQVHSPLFTDMSELDQTYTSLLLAFSRSLGSSLHPQSLKLKVLRTKLFKQITLCAAKVELLRLCTDPIVVKIEWPFINIAFAFVFQSIPGKSGGSSASITKTSAAKVDHDEVEELSDDQKVRRRRRRHRRRQRFLENAPIC